MLKQTLLLLLALNPAMFFNSKSKIQNSKFPPLVGFCDLVKNPQLYFGKTVRITATFIQATEGQYLVDESCDQKERLGVGYFEADSPNTAEFNKVITQIHSPGFDGRATVTVTGILRDVSRHDFVWYEHRFDIVRFDSVGPVIEPFEGDLETGVTYRARVRYKRSLGLWPVIPLKMPIHTAKRIEWVNLKDFPQLRKMTPASGETEIVFRVLKTDIAQANSSRWNQTVRCLILPTQQQTQIAP